MLSEKQMSEIRNHLNNAQNPLFFFDNDADGFCSFLLLARYIGRGKGVPIKSFPKLSEGYVRKLYELRPDYVFILDKPLVSKEFIDEARKLNLPIVWIDHHEGTDVYIKDVDYYNVAKPVKGVKKSEEPVSYWSYKITNNEKDLWLAMVGCVGDHYFPNFSKQFGEKYPELWDSPQDAAEALYETKIGKLARVFDFALKDRTSKVVRMIKKLLKVSSPHEVLKDSKNNKILDRFKHINKKYKRFVNKARKQADNNNNNKLLFFKYGGGLSLSGDIANELAYHYPDKVIVVAYIKGDRANVSIRGARIKEITLKALQDLDNASGGGHPNATGATVMTEDLDKFKEKLEDLA